MLRHALPVMFSASCQWGLIRDCGIQGKAGMGMYSQFEKERDQGNFDLLPELHSILSGMKVTLSWPLHLQQTKQQGRPC